MEKRTRIKEQNKRRTRSRTTEVERAVKHLLAQGAVEIPRNQWNKEPYKSWMRGIRHNGKFRCE